tara:strand:- start:387 stop:644 length:258 start_codon:yes stop_codon:yes gene_type:complete
METQNECKWDTKEDDCVIENEIQDDDEDDDDDILSIDDGYKSDELENEYTKEIEDDNDLNVMLPHKEIIFKKNQVEWLNEEEYLV